MSCFGGFLKLSTAVKVPVGPMVDAIDGFTLETSIALATTEAYLYKHDAAAAVDLGTATLSAHLGGGVYNLSLTASHTDTVGLLTLEVHDTAARPFRVSFMVLPAMIYDSLFAAAATDYLQVDVTQIGGNAIAGFLSGTTLLNTDVIKVNGNVSSGLLSGTTALNADIAKISGSSTAADNLEASALGIKAGGVVSSGSSTTVIKTNLTETNNDHWNGRAIVFITGANALVAASITDYSGSSKDLTITAVPVAPAAADTFIIV
jgi:hypothetical protein